MTVWLLCRMRVLAMVTAVEPESREGGQTQDLAWVVGVMPVCVGLDHTVLVWI